MRIFWSLLGKRKAEFLGVLVVSSLPGAIEALLHPLMVKWLFDEAVIAQDFRRFLYLSLGYIVLGLSIVGLAYGVSLWKKAFENRMILDLEQQLLEKALLFDWRGFSRQGVGSFVSRIHKDTLEGFPPMLGLTLRFVGQAIAASVFIGVLLYLSWKATLALLFIAPPSFGSGTALASASSRLHLWNGIERPAIFMCLRRL